MSRDPKVSALREVPMFASCTDRELAKIAALVDEIRAPAGHVLMEQGRVGSECFVIASGEADVSIDGEHVATLGPGQIVGEMALIDLEPRSATVTCSSPVHLFVLDNRSFASLITQHSAIARKVLRALAGRLREADRSLSMV